MKFRHILRILLLAFLSAGAVFASPTVALGGRAVMMIADAVYLFPQASKNVLAVAGADQGLGVFLSSIDKDFSKKPVLDRNAGAEVYAALKPDAVIMKLAMKKTLGPALDSLGIRQLYLNLESPEDYIADIATLGEFFGDKARARTLTTYYEQAVGRVTAATSTLARGERPGVLVIQASGASEGVWEVPPASWMQTRMTELAGGNPVWVGANPGSGWAKVNAEQIAAWNPDAVFVINYRENAEKSATAFRADARFAKVSAIRSGAVYGFVQDFYSWDQPDTRWILGLTWMAKKMHPNRFANVSIKVMAREFFDVLYGMDKSAFDTIIAPRLSGDVGE